METVQNLQVFIEPLREADAAIATLRVSVGSFFAISGFHKLFHPVRKASIYKTLKKLRIPFPEFNRYWVPGVEFVAGLTLAVGLGSTLSALLLGAICLVACITDGFERMREYQRQGAILNRLDWFNTLQYLPEVPYGILILAIVLAGPDAFTLDQWLKS